MSDFTGWNMRSAILRRDAESKLLAPLLKHGWTAVVDRIEPVGEYALIIAERNGFTRRVALLYSSATDNSVYRRLESEFDLTLFNGEPYMVAEFTCGLTRPVFSVGDFHLRMIEWNRESAPDRLAPLPFEKPAAESIARAPRVRRLLSETPIDTIWSRLSRLRSSTLARRAVAERAQAESFELPKAVADSKGDGVAYAIRNATDYFALKHVGSVSQRVLNLYYGTLSFAFAEILAIATGPSELSSIEDATKQGHGLWTCDGTEGGFADFAIGPSQAGFFTTWMKSICAGPLLAMDRKPRRAPDLLLAPAERWVTMEQLFARVPEIGDLFEDVFSGSPAWVTPLFDQGSNRSLGLHGSGERAKTTYVLLLDDSGRMTADRVAAFPGPIREITQVASGTRARHFRAAVDHPDKEQWWEALNIHHSPFERSALILPLFGCVQDYRAVCLTILYGLSILVRYRPSLWRRIQEGDLDHMLALVEAFLTAAERILPEQFLASVTGERISIHQPGSFFS